MKKIVLLLSFIFVISNSFAQSVEWEIINVGLPFGFQADEAGNAISVQDKGFSLGTEIRYNYLEKRLSSGFQFSFTGWNRRTPDSDYELHQNPFMFLAVTDYNFLELNPKKIMPFAGIGLGYSLVRSWSYIEPDTDFKFHFACSPRVGIEFFKRIRLTAEYQYIGNKNNFFNVNLGFVIGS
jgi:hypothetical protein